MRKPPEPRQPSPDAVKPEKWSPLPMSYVRVAGEMAVRSMSNARGLKKGEVYYISLITDKGLLQLVGNIDQLFPMSQFQRPLHGGVTWDAAQDD